MTDLREKIARAIVEDGYNPATAPGITDAALAVLPDAGALVEALERRDAKASECPINRPRCVSKPDENCPRCFAKRNDVCFVKHDADYRFVSEVRAALAARDATNDRRPEGQGEPVEAPEDVKAAIHASMSKDFDRRCEPEKAINFGLAVDAEDGGYPEPQAEPATSFQTRVDAWMDVCFGQVIKADAQERCDRFIEEALEFVQAAGYSAERAHALVDYTFGRPQGEINQEAGGVMVTLAAMCNTLGVDIDAAAETELARIWTKVEQIRAKQAAKPTGSALPVAKPQTEPAADEVDTACNAFCDVFSHGNAPTVDDMPDPEIYRNAMRAALSALQAKRDERVIAWLRDPKRREFVPMPETPKDGFWTTDDYGELEWVPPQLMMKRLPTVRDYADAIERGEHLK